MAEPSCIRTLRMTATIYAPAFQSSHRSTLLIVAGIDVGCATAQRKRQIDFGSCSTIIADWCANGSDDPDTSVAAGRSRVGCGRRSTTTVPPAILLVLTGVALALVPGLPPVKLSPELVLLLVLPPVIYWSAVSMSWREFRFNLRPFHSSPWVASRSRRPRSLRLRTGCWVCLGR